MSLSPMHSPSGWLTMVVTDIDGERLAENQTGSLPISTRGGIEWAGAPVRIVGCDNIDVVRLSASAPIIYNYLCSRWPEGPLSSAVRD